MPMLPQPPAVGPPTASQMQPRVVAPPPPQGMPPAVPPGALGGISPQPPTPQPQGMSDRDRAMMFLQGGLNTMAAAGRPGATALGAIGQGFGPVIQNAEMARARAAAEQQAQRLKEREFMFKLMELNQKRDIADRRLNQADDHFDRTPKGTAAERLIDQLEAEGSITSQRANELREEAVLGRGQTINNIIGEGSPYKKRFGQTYAQSAVEAVDRALKTRPFLKKIQLAEEQIRTRTVRPHAFGTMIARIQGAARALDVDLDNVLARYGLGELTVGSVPSAQVLEAIGKDLVLEKLNNIKGNASNKELEQALKATLSLNLEPEAALEILNLARTGYLYDLNRGIDVLESVEDKNALAMTDLKTLTKFRQDLDTAQNKLPPFKRPDKPAPIDAPAVAKLFFNQPAMANRATLKEIQAILNDKVATSILTQSKRGRDILEKFRASLQAEKQRR